MHKYVKEVLMPYLKEQYRCPKEFTLRDLQELKLWGETIEKILCADLKYHEIDQMEREEEENDKDMSGEELLEKFKEMYTTADSTTRLSWKSLINKIIS